MKRRKECDVAGFFGSKYVFIYVFFIRLVVNLLRVKVINLRRFYVNEKRNFC